MNTFANLLLLPVTVSVLSHEGQPVVASGVLADLYGCTSQAIEAAFSAHRHLFAEGRHHHTLTGQSLRAFRPFAAARGVHIAPRAQHCLLWRRQGAALHAHLHGTDKAWQAFETLDETVFNPPRNAARQHPLPPHDSSPCPARLSPHAHEAARQRLEQLRARLSELEPSLGEACRLIRDIRDALAPLHIALLDAQRAGQGRGASFERVISLLEADTYQIENTLREAATDMRHCLLRGKDILCLLDACR